MTKNDEKSIHGFTDWYGATLWMAMPMLVSSLVSLVLLTFQEPGAEISAAILAPLSLAFILGTDMASPWFNLLTIVSIDSIWLIFLAYVCVRTWTNFSQTRAAEQASRQGVSMPTPVDADLRRSRSSSDGRRGGRRSSSRSSSPNGRGSARTDAADGSRDREQLKLQIRR